MGNTEAIPGTDPSRPDPAFDQQPFEINDSNSLHVIRNREWARAVVSLARNLDAYHWKLPSGIQRGDTLVTILDCKPPIVSCIEKVLAVGDNTVEVEPRFDFPCPIIATDLERNSQLRLGSPHSKWEGREASKILDVLQGLSQVLPASAMSRADCSSADAAEEWSAVIVTKVLQLAAAHGDVTCSACGDQSAEFEGHFFETFAEGRRQSLQELAEAVELLCADCHARCHITSLKSLRAATRPSCPTCRASNPRIYLWGIPAVPVDEEEVMAGCVLPEGPVPQFLCRSCSTSYAVLDTEKHHENSGSLCSPRNTTISQPWDRNALVDRGFCGFIPIRRLSSEDIPELPGVYAVLAPGDRQLSVGTKSQGGHFKGNDPTMDVSLLEDRLLPDTNLLYLGAAEAGSAGNRGLRARVGELLSFGKGRAVGHWGGRALWQLESPEDLLLAWMPCPPHGATKAKSDLLSEFRKLHGQLPFANLRS